MLVRNALHRDARKLPLAREVENIIRRQSLAFNGVWYDPSDFSSLFQDSAGTTPVTAAGQPVGLMLDKTRGLKLGPELVTNGDFSSGIAGWSASGPADLTYQSGRIRVTKNAVGTYPVAYQNIPIVSGKFYKITCDYWNPSGATIHVSFGSIVNNIGNATSGRAVFYLTATPTAVRIEVGFSSSSGAVGQYMEFDNVTCNELPGNHATQSAAGYKPLLQTENNLNYLVFDGIDDFLVTGNVNFSASDKIAVAAGVRKLSDASAGTIVELSADATGGGANNGVFTMLAPSGPSGNNFYWRSKGTLPADCNHQFVAAPISRVESGLGNIGGDSASIRTNSIPVVTAGNDQGTGNYGNYPIYIGRRGGLSNPFNGRLYGLAICGGMDDIYKLKKIERYLAQKTGVII